MWPLYIRQTIIIERRENPRLAGCIAQGRVSECEIPPGSRMEKEDITDTLKRADKADAESCDTDTFRS